MRISDWSSDVCSSDLGGTWLLPRTIGMSRAAELFFTGDTIDAETACEWGLVSRVVPHETLMDEALALAGKIAAMPPHALRLTKRSEERRVGKEGGRTGRYSGPP